MPCFAAVYGADSSRGAEAEIEPLLMIRPPHGALPPHDPERLLGAEKGASEVRLDHRLPVLGVELFKRRRSGRTRVVKQEIQATETRLDLREQRRDGGRVPNVDRERDRAVACLRGCLFERVAAAAGGDDGEPAPASATAAARPIPLPAPVTTAIVLTPPLPA